MSADDSVGTLGDDVSLHQKQESLHLQRSVVKQPELTEETQEDGRTDNLSSPELETADEPKKAISSQQTNAEEKPNDTVKSGDVDEGEDEDDDQNDGDISLLTSPRANDSSSFGATSHRRIDSVPPQKYDVGPQAANGLSASLASTCLHSTIEEEESDISLPQYDDSTDPQLSRRSPSAFRSHFLSSQQDVPEALTTPTAIDKADLNFVDITLDAPVEESELSGNLLEPPHPLAGSTRTAEQIRRDSYSSRNLQASSSSAPSQPESSLSPGSVSNEPTHDQSPPTSPSQNAQGATDQMTGNRSIEGRYRGRRSAATSRAASPTRSPSSSPSRRNSIAPSHTPGSAPANVTAPPQNGLSVTPAPVLLAADENGNISVVQDVPLSPRTVPRAVASEGNVEDGLHAADTQHAEPEAARTEARTSEQDLNQSTEATRDGGISQNARAATSLSEEVEAADAAEASNPPASDTKERSAASSSAPPNGDGTKMSSSQGLSDKADQIDPKKRRKSSSAGADPVESRTRMTTLPAKTKTEEIKHRADFERMMMAAKEAERKKREEEEERKRQRQDEQRQALGRWEKEILPSWSRARKDPELGQLWWKGAPPSIRGRVWALAIGNPLMLPRNLLEQSEKKAAGSENTPIGQIIPPRVLVQIDDDIEEALPSLKLFQANGPLHDDLVRLCRAFVLVRMEQVAELDVAGDADIAAIRHQNASPPSRKAELPSIAGASESSVHAENSLPGQDDREDEYALRGIDLYQPGLASLAAVLLINMSINTAFIALLNLLHSKPWLKALYSLLPNVLPPNVAPAKNPSIAPTTRKTGSAFTLPPKEKAIRGFERVLETLLADQMPKVYANLLARNVRLYRVVLRDWVSTLWSRWLDVDTVMRLWDVVLLDETDSMIYRVCLALVQALESRLYVPDQEELESVLKGTNKAALAIWRREKEMKGELEVHAQRSLAAPRHSRSSISSTSMPQQHPEQAADPYPTTTSASTTSQDESRTLPTIDSASPAAAGGVASPPPRTSSLTQPTLHLPDEPSTSSSDPLDFEDITPRDYIYEQYAIKEDLMFETLEAQQSWWKQSTLQRLLDRELSE